MGSPAEILDLLGNWTWWIVAAALFILELLVPGVFFLWLGAAAMIVGGLALFVDMSWQLQVATFAVLSVVTLVVSRRYFAPRSAGTDHPNLNKRVQQYVGQVYLLDEPIVNGRGALKIGDSIWRITGPDLAAGRKVVVTGAEGVILIVAAAESAG